MGTGEMKDRYEYILEKFPDEPWLGEKEEEVGIVSSPKEEVGKEDAEGPPSNPTLQVVDEWLISQSLNEFGDPEDTVYMGGNPLFDPVTGEMKDRYEYILEKFPDEPWLGKEKEEEVGIVSSPEEEEEVGKEDAEEEGIPPAEGPPSN